MLECASSCTHIFFCTAERVDMSISTFCALDYSCIRQIVIQYILIIQMRINQLVVVLVLLCLAVCAAGKAMYIEYHRQWEKVVPGRLVVNVTASANKQQRCDKKSCEFYYYLYENAELAKEASRNRTVLVVSGLQGDQSLAPDVLLKSYGKVAAARIIFFPMANPSGYMQGTKTTFPNQMDVFEDIPVNNNLVCNRTSAFKIIEGLYLKYPIDLSIFVHEGTSIISYPWTREYKDRNIKKASDHQLYADIAGMLAAYDIKHYPSQHKPQSQQVDDTGSLVDWAYGASHYPSLLSKSCEGKSLPKYPDNTMNGLVFSVGLGRINQSQTTQQQTTNLLKRGLTVLEKLVSLVNPQIVIGVKEDSVTVFIEGCKIGSLSYLKIVDSQGKIVLQKKDETNVTGDVTGEQITPSSFQTEGKLHPSSYVKYEAKFKCGEGWIGLGKTTFAKMHEFTTHGQVNPAAALQQIMKEDAAIQWESYQIFLATILTIVAVFWAINCLKTAMKLRRARKLSEFHQKFQQIEYVEDVQAYETGLEPKEQEKHDDRFKLTE